MSDDVDDRLIAKLEELDDVRREVAEYRIKVIRESCSIEADARKEGRFDLAIEAARLRAEALADLGWAAKA
jgi:hypothetical protein